ncbi:MAG: hypothetical protein QW334_00440 [Thermofilum sp.]
MRIEEYLKLKKKVFEKCCDLSVRKGHDYSGMEDTLANLKAARILGVKPEQGVLVRLLDKIMRLKNFVERGELQVSDETVFDTVADAHNYLDLLLALIVEEREEESFGR